MNNSPSFSSSLLEEIYRSFDNDIDTDYNYSHSRRSSKIAKFSNTSAFSDDFTADGKTVVHRHLLRHEVDRYLLQQWMDKAEKAKEIKENAAKLRRNSMREDDVSFRRPLNSSSSTSSSDSSSGIGGFSSSDTESLNRAPARLKAKIPSLKPIRTAATSPEFRRKSYSDEIPAMSSKKKSGKKEGKLQQRALKLYGDLKKVKQPISPGGKLAGFLNSLFNSGNSRKPKTEPVTSSSVPSTATSYSRSCLSKTPSSAGRLERRSVRFCPVNVVVDETGQKSVHNDDVSRMEVCDGGHGGDEVKELLKNYRISNNQIRKELKVNVVVTANHGNYSSKNNIKVGYNGSKINLQRFEDEDEDEDGESCCSSDLFELDNLLEIGLDDRYRQELPVYETTHVRTNRAIANGFIL